MNWSALKAIFRRDFVSYFSNPTGYVFICVFVVLSALAAFWPPDFFSNNLANLDQLNKWLPFILLVFVPAITMSIWAEERRQGTDELLLTLPAGDIEVVLGKYLAAVAIYTVSLLFSMFSIYLVFSYGLGTPDGGLFLGTYIGYWFIGLAMLSIGMVASFLTNNLTVGFVMGMVFNLPLAMFGVADWIIKNPYVAQAIKKWSAAEQFHDFERGVVSLAGISYFVLITAVMLYVSIVLIGRRHWGGREEKESMWAHYLARALGLAALVIGVNLYFSHHNSLRADMTSENLNSLAPDTVELVRDLRTDDKAKPIKIDAYVSPQVPAEYVQHKLSLLSTLSELSSLSGGKIQVEVHEIENFSDQATLANESFGIAPRSVQAINRGVRKPEEIILGAAFSSGLNRVVIPFIDKGIPVEYELVRSIVTVADQERKKLGVLTTDVPLIGGGLSMSMQGPEEESRIISELKKQYDVVAVDPANPIDEKFDVLLAVQPSTLSPEAMANFVEVVKAGQPTAIFEDPYPQFFDVPGTSQPKRPQQGPLSFLGGGQTLPKGDLTQLWRVLEVDLRGDRIVWQRFNPVSKFGTFPEEWVFIDEALVEHGTPYPFDPKDSISAGLRQLLFPAAGAWLSDRNPKLKITPLAVTGKNTGTVSVNESMIETRSRGAMPARKQSTFEAYPIAVHVTGQISGDEGLSLSGDGSDAGKGKQEDGSQVGKQPKKTDINVVLVADIDWIAPIIFELRERGNEEDMMVDWQFQNVAFVLNVLDSLAGDDRFMQIRKRTRAHRILTRVEEATEQNRQESLKEQEKFIQEAQDQIDAAEKRFRDKVEEVQKLPNIDPRTLRTMIDMVEDTEQRALEVQVTKLKRERDDKVKQSERELASQIRGVQDKYKLLAVLVPPILPILLALAVFFHRRKAEQEGVNVERLRYGRAKTDAKQAVALK